MNKFRIVTLCGSTKYKDDFIRVQKELTLKGNIVISVGLFGHIDCPEIMNTDTKIMLDEMRKQKIDIADEIYVINKNGYIGESTKSEIDYAYKHDKTISYMEGDIICTGKCYNSEIEISNYEPEYCEDKIITEEEIRNGCNGRLIGRGVCRE